MAGLRTEFPFTLPKGYISDDGVLHRDGVMRLATARDEIEPLRDRSIDGPDDPYLTILVLARVITQLGSMPSVGTREIEGLFAADLAFLQDLYGIVNFGDQADVAALQDSVLGPSDVVDEFYGDELDGGEGFEADAVDAADDGTGEVDAPTEPAADEARPARSPRTRGRIEEVTPTGHG